MMNKVIKVNKICNLDYRLNNKASNRYLC